MILTEAAFADFRNIGQQTLRFDPNVTVLHGRNGQGKTNALEGISFFSTCRSFRTPHDSEFIRFGCREAGISLRFRDGKSPVSMQCVFRKGEKRRSCRIDGSEVSQMADFIGIFRSVIFTPVHLRLVTEGAQLRRRFLDSAICQLDSRFLTALQRYRRVLEQRNSYLKQQGLRHGMAAAYDDMAASLSAQLASDGAFIARRRAEYCEKLSAFVSAFFADMTEGHEVPGLEYRTVHSAEEYLSMMEGGYAGEIRAGCSLFGPHRDDLSLTLSGADARYFASQGQLRSLALALKLGEGEISRAQYGSYPVFLLDDVLSEFDPARRAFLLRGLSDRQIVITACDEVRTSGLVYEVENGVFTAVGGGK